MALYQSSEGLLYELSPARLFAHVDSKRCLGDDLVGEERVGGVEASASRVPEQALQLVAAEHAAAARYIHGPIDDAPGRLHSVMFGGDDLRRPCRSMVDATRPVVGHLVQMRCDRVEGQNHLRDPVLDLWVIGHGAG